MCSGCFHFWQRREDFPGLPVISEIRQNVSDHTAGRNDSDHTTSAKALRAVQRQHVVGTGTDPDLLVQCVLHLDRTG